MKLRAALPMMLCLLVAAIGPRADAQLALPQVQIPDPAHTLPPLPELNAEPLLSAGDRLTGLRLDRITEAMVFGRATSSDQPPVKIG